MTFILALVSIKEPVIMYLFMHVVIEKDILDCCFRSELIKMLLHMYSEYFAPGRCKKSAGKRDFA